ncbi:hypothetical protein BC831DRAFT_508341 [Entophlyctis helioformis]|nr:hypothetical protein BC831DRAFT_508341 [Entophlyctis helioformis]
MNSLLNFVGLTPSRPRAAPGPNNHNGLDLTGASNPAPVVDHSTPLPPLPGAYNTPQTQIPISAADAPRPDATPLRPEVLFSEDSVTSRLRVFDAAFDGLSARNQNILSLRAATKKVAAAIDDRLTAIESALTTLVPVIISLSKHVESMSPVVAELASSIPASIDAIQSSVADLQTKTSDNAFKLGIHNEQFDRITHAPTASRDSDKNPHRTIESMIKGAATFAGNTQLDQLGADGVHKLWLSFSFTIDNAVDSWASKTSFTGPELASMIIARFSDVAATWAQEWTRSTPYEDRSWATLRAAGNMRFRSMSIHVNARQTLENYKQSPLKAPPFEVWSESIVSLLRDAGYEYGTQSTAIICKLVSPDLASFVLDQSRLPEVQSFQVLIERLKDRYYNRLESGFTSAQLGPQRPAGFAHVREISTGSTTWSSVSIDNMPHLSDAGRAFLRANSGCFRCRGPGHLASECQAFTSSDVLPLAGPGSAPAVAARATNPAPA